MENQNSTTSNSEKVDYAIQEEEIENEEGQQNGKTLSRGQKKKLKKKLQKEKGAQGEPSEIDNLASKVNEVQINEAKPSNSTEESKQDSKTGQNSDSQNKDDANADSNKDKGSEDKEPELTPEEQFKKELAWCIRQITLGLENNKVTRDQLKESTDVLRILQNPDAPIIKKRHLMKVVFGDYRKLMKTIK